MNLEFYSESGEITYMTTKSDITKSDVTVSANGDRDTSNFTMVKLTLNSSGKSEHTIEIKNQGITVATKHINVWKVGGNPELRAYDQTGDKLFKVAKTFPLCLPDGVNYPNITITKYTTTQDIFPETSPVSYNNKNLTAINTWLEKNRPSTVTFQASSGGFTSEVLAVGYEWPKPSFVQTNTTKNQVGTYHIEASTAISHLNECKTNQVIGTNTSLFFGRLIKTEISKDLVSRISSNQVRVKCNHPEPFLQDSRENTLKYDNTENTENTTIDLTFEGITDGYANYSDRGSGISTGFTNLVLCHVLPLEDLAEIPLENMTSLSKKWILTEQGDESSTKNIDWYNDGLSSRFVEGTNSNSPIEWVSIRTTSGDTDLILQNITDKESTASSDQDLSNQTLQDLKEIYVRGEATEEQIIQFRESAAKQRKNEFGFTTFYDTNFLGQKDHDVPVKYVVGNTVILQESLDLSLFREGAEMHIETLGGRPIGRYHLAMNGDRDSSYLILTTTPKTCEESRLFASPNRVFLRPPRRQLCFERESSVPKIFDLTDPNLPRSPFKVLPDVGPERLETAPREVVLDNVTDKDSKTFKVLVSLTDAPLYAMNDRFIFSHEDGTQDSGSREVLVLNKGYVESEDSESPTQVEITLIKIGGFELPDAGESGSIVVTLQPVLTTPSPKIEETMDVDRAMLRMASELKKSSDGIGLLSEAGHSFLPLKILLFFGDSAASIGRIFTGWKDRKGLHQTYVSVYFYMNLVLRAFNTFTEVSQKLGSSVEDTRIQPSEGRSRIQVLARLLKDVLEIIAKKIPFLGFVIKLGEFLMSLAGKIKTAINKAALTFLYTFERIHEVFFRIVGFTRDNARNSNVTYEGLMAEHRKEYDIEAVNMLREKKNYSRAKSDYQRENSWKYGSIGDAGKIFDQSILHDQKSIRVPGVMSREEIDLGGFFTTNSIGFFDTQTAGGSLLNKLLKKIGVGFGAWLSPTDVNVAYELEYGTRKKIYQDVKVGNRSRRWDHELWQVDRDREIRRQYFMIPEGRRVEYQEIKKSTETYMRQTSLKGSSVPQRRIAAAFEYLLEREDTEREDYGYGKGSYAEKEQQTQEFFRTYTDEVFDVPISSWASPVNSHATKEDIAEKDRWTTIDRTGITGEKFEGVRVRGMLGLKSSVDDLTDQEKNL